jgi:predicted DCC family thiol-disulfide oxidoreductase YuxK
MKSDKIFLYDGDCNFCKKLINKLISLNTNPDIQFISFRNKKDFELKKIHSDLTLDILEGEIQFIHNGVRFPGFFGIRKLFPYLQFYKYFTFLLYIPLVPFLGMLVLYILKKNRY